MVESLVQGPLLLPASPNSYPCPWGCQVTISTQNDKEEE